MPPSLGDLLSYFRRLAPERAAGPEADGVLLSRFVQGDGGAFTALVTRYAPLVWGVCRRLLGATPDAEDAFQATFVICARKAASFAGDRPLGPWLHKVAHDTAVKVMQRARRLRERESRLVREPAVHDQPDFCRVELGAILEEELGRLPDRLRLPLVLCYLEGLTNEQAADRLGCPKGTVLSRISRAKDRLRDRLARRGVEPPLEMSLDGLAAKVVPRGAVEAICQAAPLLQAGGTGGLSTPVVKLAKGVVFDMVVRKLVVACSVLVTLIVVAGGAGWLGGRPATPAVHAALLADPEPEEPEKEAKAPDPPTKTPEKRKEPQLPLAADEATIRGRLAKVVEFGGIEDPRTTLREALNQFTIVYRLQFTVNTRAFEQARQNEVITCPVGHTPIMPMRARLRDVLNTVLAALPVEAMFLIRQDSIEITTRKAVMAELGLSPERLAKMGVAAGVPLVLVNSEFTNTPVKEVMKQLVEATGANILLDPRIEKKADAEVTARLMNVPVETAVRLLADMAGLAVVRRENVLYVTTAENAARLRKAD